MNEIIRFARTLIFDMHAKTKKSRLEKTPSDCEKEQHKPVNHNATTTTKNVVHVKSNIPNLIYVKPKPDISVIPKGKEINISKIGSDHEFYDICNQDYIFRLPNLKIVLDGCGSCKFSEVGVKLFSQFLATRADEINEKNFERIVREIFEELLKVFNTDKFICDNLLFTIVACIETKESYHVFYAGDGFVITNNGLQIDLLNLENEEYPAYYAYNYIVNKKLLRAHCEGVIFKSYCFSKNQYKNIGVATDGICFYMDLEPKEQIILWKALGGGNPMSISKILNVNKNLFKDDVTICM